MAKADANKVNPYIAEKAISSGKDLQALYSECVMVSWHTTGKMACGFDAKDLVAYVKEKHPLMFDEKGKRK